VSVRGSVFVGSRDVLVHVFVSLDTDLCGSVHASFGMSVDSCVSVFTFFSLCVFLFVYANVCLTCLWSNDCTCVVCGRCVQILVSQYFWANVSACL